MPPPEKIPRAEREQTDDSLRVEREVADAVLGDNGAAFDATADAVIVKARAHADELLAAARAKTDRQSGSSAVGPIIARERAREDSTLRKERAVEDETIRDERAEHSQLLTDERDATDKDLLNERARSDRAVATRDEFLGIVSHDLRNMLGTVVLSAAAIEESASEENGAELIAGYAQRIRRSAARMNRLIGDLVDVASIEAGRLLVTREMGDPIHVVAEAVDAFRAQASTAGISVVTEIVSPVPRVELDAARILQVLGNLVGNAIKFTPAPGRVVIHVERVGDDLRFAVSDTGMGIPGDKLEAVFERFLQIDGSDRRGVGLGLFICRCIVRGHGGRIWAESTMGVGSTIFFTLPMSRH